MINSAVASPSTYRILRLALAGLLGSACFAQAPGTITTIAGNGVSGFSGDGGPALGASFNSPTMIAFAGDGSYYVSDFQNQRIRKVAADGKVSTIAGTGAAAYNGDGILAVNAALHDPTGVALDSTGTVYIADAANDRIRKIDKVTGMISTFAGSGVRGFSGDGGPAAAAMLACPTRIKFNSSGVLYIADQCNHRIRTVDLSGTIRTVAGTGPVGAAFGGFSGDGGPALAAQFKHPTAFDFVRRVSASDVVSTIAGNGVRAFSGDGGPGLGASMSDPGAVAVDPEGNVYFGDTNNNRVRRIGTNGVITTFAGTGAAASTGDGGPASAAAVHEPFGVAFDTQGNLYVLESGSGKIRRIQSVSPPFEQPPSIAAGGIISANLAPKVSTISPLSIISVFGTGFTSETVLFPNLASNGNLAAKLGGVCLEMNGERLPLFAATPTQLNAQASAAQAFGPVSLTAISNCDTAAQLRSAPLLVEAARAAAPSARELSSNVEMVTVEAAAPSFFLYPPLSDNGFIAARFNTGNAAVAPDGMFNDQFGPSRPAKPGDIVVLYGTGWGQTSANLAAGELAAGAAEVLDAGRTVTFDGVVMDPADVFYVGVTPQAAGLYQLAIKIPASAAPGNRHVVLTVYGKSTPAGPVIPIVAP
jgi:uncharacterized protein (TIGR03437 family)